MEVRRTFGKWLDSLGTAMGLILTNLRGIGLIMWMTLTQEASPDADEINSFRTTYNRTLAQGNVSRIQRDSTPASLRGIHS